VTGIAGQKGPNPPTGELVMVAVKSTAKFASATPGLTLCSLLNDMGLAGWQDAAVTLLQHLPSGVGDRLEAAGAGFLNDAMADSAAVIALMTTDVPIWSDISEQDLYFCVRLLFLVVAAATAVEGQRTPRTREWRALASALLPERWPAIDPAQQPIRDLVSEALDEAAAFGEVEAWQVLTRHLDIRAHEGSWFEAAQALLNRVPANLYHRLDAAGLRWLVDEAESCGETVHLVRASLDGGEAAVDEVWRDAGSVSAMRGVAGLFLLTTAVRAVSGSFPLPTSEFVNDVFQASWCFGRRGRVTVGSRGA